MRSVRLRHVVDATLIVVSRRVQLSILESVLGESRLKSHDLGSIRKNGTIRQQAIWMRDWSVFGEPPNSPLSQVLLWFASRRDQLLAIDPDAAVKLSATLEPEGGFSVPVELASQLSELKVHLNLGSKERL
jgi:hypothetical protein